MQKAAHSGLVTYVFENGVEITGTQDHPFRIKRERMVLFIAKKIGAV
ncbi:MAG: hypothetical protein GX857_10175 [Bacteroidales bacterium]|nr:hypothetical protein [Bacteroidales bacterium]